MTVPIQNLVFIIPSLITIGVLRVRGQTWKYSFGVVGWQRTSLRYLVIGLLMGVVTGAFASSLSPTIPPEILEHPSIATSQYAGLTLGLQSFFIALFREGIFVALGEEVFFRGFLGCVLTRRLGFQIGNLLQAIIFLLPHLFILTVSTTLWPILIPQFLAGWVYGLLVYKSGSILPSWIAHSLGNAFGAVAFMM
jgi:membrane protease YdiL (CAAX protease family)